MACNGNVIGIDIGGTNFRIGTVSLLGDVSHVEIQSSKFIGSSGDALGTIAGFIEEYIKKNRTKDVKCISIGIPGMIDKERKSSYSVPNIMDKNGVHVLDNTNIVDGLEHKLNIPIVINRDVNNLLAYDMLVYDLYDKDIVIGCYIGTGFGGAIHIFGDYLLGKNGVANEIGHIPYYQGELYCTCGKKACTECYASGRALRLLQEEHYPTTFIGDIFKEHGQDTLLDEFVEACALPIATEATIFDPDYMIIGGGVVDMPGFPKEKLVEYVRQHTRQPLPADNLELLYSKQCRDMGIIGAAIYAMKQQKMDVGGAFVQKIKEYV